MEILNNYIEAFITVSVAIGGAFVTVKTLLTRHDEKIGRIEKDIEEIKEERISIHNDMKQMFKLLNKVNTTVAVLEERTKPH